MISHLDHTFTFAPRGDLDGALARLRAAGFRIHDQQILHQGGKRSGFAVMTGTYLEVMAVADEEEFARSATEEELGHRSRARPFGIAAAAPDIAAARAGLSASIPDLAPAEVRPVLGDESGPPGWAILRPPGDSTPGAELLVIQYLRRPLAPTPQVVGPNAIYGIGGYYFCAARIEESAARWGRTLAPAMAAVRAGAELTLGPQRLIWIAEAEHQAMFGERPLEREVLRGGLCGVHLLTTSLAASKEWFERGGLRVVREGDRQLSTQPDPSSGYSFVVEETAGDAAAFAAAIDARRRL